MKNRVYLKLNEPIQEKLVSLEYELELIRGLSLKDIKDIKKLKKSLKYILLNEKIDEVIVIYEIPIEICIEFQEALFHFEFGGRHLAEIFDNETQTILVGIIRSINEAVNNNYELDETLKFKYNKSYNYINGCLHRYD